MPREVPIPSIIIDGYNLIGIHHRDLEAQRESLIGLLAEFRRKKGHTIVVVFDGWKDGSGRESSSVRGGVKIVYSGLGEKADSVIKRIISSERREWIVVSSDREIASHAWSTGSIPIPSEMFLPYVEAGERADYDRSDDPLSEKRGDDHDTPEHRKGNPRQLSRKERAVRRALSKL